PKFTILLETLRLVEKNAVGGRQRSGYHFDGFAVRNVPNLRERLLKGFLRSNSHRELRCASHQQPCSQQQRQGGNRNSPCTRFLGLHVAPPGRQLPKCDLSVDCCALIRKSISGQRSTNNSHLRRSCVPLTLVHGAFPPRTEANQQLGVPRIVTFKQLP